MFIIRLLKNLLLYSSLFEVLFITVLAFVLATTQSGERSSLTVLGLIVGGAIFGIVVGNKVVSAVNQTWQEHLRSGL
jgi:hypothetical protein